VSLLSGMSVVSLSLSFICAAPHLEAATVSRPSMSTATPVGFCGPVKVRMLVTPCRPKTPPSVVRDRLVAPAMLPEPVHRLCRKSKTSNFFLDIRILFQQGAGLSLTTHARVLLCTAHDLRGVTPARGRGDRGHHRAQHS